MSRQRHEADDLLGFPLHEAVLPFPKQSLSIVSAKDPLDLAGCETPDGRELQEVYWGAIWSSAIVLANELLEGQVALPDDTILEIGCGTGLVSVAAALAGGPETRVLATDIEPLALTLTMENARRNKAWRSLSTREIDWRRPYNQRHKLILAADCLYEPEAGNEVAAFVRGALSSEPDALAIVVDPERWSARTFAHQAQKAGLHIEYARKAVPFGAHGPNAADSDNDSTPSLPSRPEKGEYVAWYELTLSP